MVSKVKVALYFMLWILHVRHPNLLGQFDRIEGSYGWGIILNLANVPLVFLFISGFCYKRFKNPTTLRQSVIRFFQKIYPLYFLSLVVRVLIGQIDFSSAFAFAFISQVFLASDIWAASWFVPCLFLGVLYLHFFGGKDCRFHIGAITTILVLRVLSFGLVAFEDYSNYMANFYSNPVLNLDAFIFGVLTEQLSRAKFHIPKILGLVLITGCLFFPLETEVERMGFIWSCLRHTILGGGLLICFLNLPNVQFKRKQYFTYTGLSFYLFHDIFIRFTDQNPRLAIFLGEIFEKQAFIISKTLSLFLAVSFAFLVSCLIQRLKR